MLAQYNLDAQLLVVVFEVLNVESADALQTVVQQPHEVPFPSPSDIRVSGAGPRVVLRNKVSIVSPVFFELLEKTMRMVEHHNALGIVMLVHGSNFSTHLVKRNMRGIIFGSFFLKKITSHIWN